MNKTVSNCIPKPTSYIKSSTELINKVKNLHIPDDHILLSLDATSLYTNTPLQLIKNSMTRLYSKVSQKRDIPLDELLEAATLIMKKNFFKFNGTYNILMGVRWVRQ